MIVIRFCLFVDFFTVIHCYIVTLFVSLFVLTFSSCYQRVESDLLEVIIVRILIVIIVIDNDYKKRFGNT